MSSMMAMLSWSIGQNEINNVIDSISDGNTINNH